MNKKNILSLFILTLISYQVFSDDVKVTTYLPASASPGSEFNVQVTINKGSISGFGKLQQELPPGFTATAMEIKGGNFSFKDQKVKIIWMSLPPEPEFTATYKISVAPDVSGEQTIGGKFQYLKDNQRTTFNINPVSISIKVATTVVSAEQTSIASSRNTSSEPATKKFVKKSVGALPMTGSKIILKNVYFDFGKYIIKSGSNPALNKLIDFMGKNSTLKIEIAGHTDNVGSRTINLRLSQKRAEAVVNYLAGRGIAKSRLFPKGYGPDYPMASNDDDDEGRELNRRVEFQRLSDDYTQSAYASQSYSGSQKSNQGITYHTVKPLNTLYSLSKMYGLSVRELKRMNGLTSNKIHIGQKLRVR
ncbi:MAG: OmpA family protein [Bacteroidetes bacterium]|nr:OmpA family protein [Bacteroidota bacterium]